MKFKMQLDTSSGVPYYKQLVNHITYCVMNNIVRPGEQLPTVRQAAVDLKVNLNTVSKAYNELELKGIVVTQQGTGTFISHHKPGIEKKEQFFRIKKICTDFLKKTADVGLTPKEVLEHLNFIVRQETYLKKKDNNQNGNTEK
jgi:GntR family transcriptional regulator